MISAAELDISKPIRAGSQDQDHCESDLRSDPSLVCSLMSSTKSSGSGGNHLQLEESCAATW